MSTTVFNNHIIHNEHALVNEEHDEYFVTHFGIMPEDDDLNFQNPPILVSGGRAHFMRDDETMLWRSPGVTAWVSGSWKCWGPANQDDEGDTSLHVKIYTPEIPSAKQLEAFWMSLWKNIREGGIGRVLDYALITGGGDNDPIAVATFGSESVPTVYPVDQKRMFPDLGKCQFCEEMHERGEKMYNHTTANHKAELEEMGAQLSPHGFGGKK